MNFIIKRIIGLILLGGLTCGLFHGYKYYLRCTDLPVRYPLINANVFRQVSDHCFDSPQKVWIYLTGRTFDPASVKDGDIIFIKNDPFYLKRFFTNIHPHIRARYILLSHNSDMSIPGDYEHYLEDNKIIAWCGCNVSKPEHPKMVSLPLGVMGILNKKIRSDCSEIWGRVLLDCATGRLKKNNLVYFNACIATNRSERGRALDYFKDKSFCTKAFGRSYEGYLREMATFKFVISPHGAGLDCYRTWEALQLGCFPVVKKSALDCLYDGLPVVIVDDWSQVTEAFLEQKYQEMTQQHYALERLSSDYWVKKIMKIRVDALGAR